MVNVRKIIYIANVRLPTEKAHGIQIAKMCEAFGAAGQDVTLVLPERKNEIREDLFSYYAVKKNFAVQKIWCLDAIRWAKVLGSVAYYIESISFAWSVASHLRRGSQNNLVYTRDVWSTLFLSSTYHIVFEAHTLPKRADWLYRVFLKKVNKFVVLTVGLRKAFIELGIAANNILVAGDAVDRRQFTVGQSPDQCREKVGLALGKKIVLYAGHLYKWKGAHTLLVAAKEFGDAIRFVFVGGTSEAVKEFQAVAKGQNNTLVVGHKPHIDMPFYLKAADVLVLPNSGKEKISRAYTSPLKLFEYMAAGRPIVAADVPAIREVLDESTATFFVPDDSRSLSKAVRFVFDHQEEAEEKAERAFCKVKEYTWESRVKKILDFIS